MLSKTARCRDPLRSASLRYTTLVPLKEGQYSLIGFIAERLTRKHCPHFKGDERREALGERSGGGLEITTTILSPINLHFRSVFALTLICFAA